jgi:hypothetical protein
VTWTGLVSAPAEYVKSLDCSPFHGLLLAKRSIDNKASIELIAKVLQKQELDKLSLHDPLFATYVIAASLWYSMPWPWRG